MFGAIYRSIGLNPLKAQALIHVTVKAIGFVSMLTLLSRIQGTNFANVFGAALFTLFISSSNQAGHGQLLAISFAPLLTLFLLEFATALLKNIRSRCLLYGILFIICFNGLLLTSYYIAWLFFLFTILYLTIFALLARDSAMAVGRAMMHMRAELLFLSLAFLFMAVPFLCVYLPKLKETGGHIYGHQLYYSLFPADVLNFGSGSLVWGWLRDLVNMRYLSIWRSGEFAVGTTPDVFIVVSFILGSLAFGRLSNSPKWLKALGLAVVVAALLPLSIKGYSLWYFVYLLVPGASGIRVICRFYIFLAFPIAILVSVALSNIDTLTLRGRALGLCLLILLCASQINLAAPAHLNVSATMAKVKQAGNVPRACRSFFASENDPAFDTEIDRLYRVNVAAMFLADRVGIPTLNGFATFNPPDWIFRNDTGYLLRVGEYIEKHRLDRVCRYDFSENRWYSPEKARFIAPSFNTLNNATKKRHAKLLIPPSKDTW